MAAAMGPVSHSPRMAIRLLLFCTQTLVDSASWLRVAVRLSLNRTLARFLPILIWSCSVCMTLAESVSPDTCTYLRSV